MKFLVLLLVSVTYVAAYSKFESCGARDAVVRLDVTQFPDTLNLRKGERLTVGFRVIVRQDLQEPIYAKLSLKRKLWFVDVPIPCVNYVGSCEYKVTCDKIREWSKVEKLPHPCPAPAGVTERTFTVTIPDVHPAVRAVGSGDYKVEVKLYTGPRRSGRELGCAKASVRVRT